MGLPNRENINNILALVDAKGEISSDEIRIALGLKNCGGILSHLVGKDLKKRWSGLRQPDTKAKIWLYSRMGKADLIELEKYKERLLKEQEEERLANRCKLVDIWNGIPKYINYQVGFHSSTDINLVKRLDRKIFD